MNLLLPNTLDESTNPEFVRALASQARVLYLDWLHCEGFTPAGKAVYHTFLHNCTCNGIQIEHLNVSDIYHEINTIGGQWKKIIPIEQESRTDSSRLDFENFLKPYLKGKNIDISGISMIFAELFLNVCQHANDKGILVISIEDNLLTIMCSDFGRTIPVNIRTAYSELESALDEEVILHAMQLGVTSKSKISNHGRGLDTLRTFAPRVNGLLLIRSGYGQIDHSPSEEVKTCSSPSKYEGTLISLRFPLDALPQAEKEDYSADIDF